MNSGMKVIMRKIMFLRMLCSCVAVGNAQDFKYDAKDRIEATRIDKAVDAVCKSHNIIERKQTVFQAVDLWFKKYVSRKKNGDYSYKVKRSTYVKGNAYSWPYAVKELTNHPTATVSCNISTNTITFVYYADCQLECEFYTDEDVKTVGRSRLYGDPIHGVTGLIGSEKRPADPYRELMGCKDGTTQTGKLYILCAKLKNYQRYTDTNKGDLLKGTFKKTCTHSNFQFQIMRGGGRLKLDGTRTQSGRIPFCPWKFKHTMTVTFNIDNIAQTNGISKKEVVLYLLRGVKGVQYDKIISFPIEDTEDICLFYCLYKKFGITDQDLRNFDNMVDDNQMANLSEKERAFVKNGINEKARLQMLNEVNSGLNQAAEYYNSVSNLTDTMSVIKAFQASSVKYDSIAFRIERLDSSISVPFDMVAIESQRNLAYTHLLKLSYLWYSTGHNKSTFEEAYANIDNHKLTDEDKFGIFSTLLGISAAYQHISDMETYSKALSTLSYSPQNDEEKECLFNARYVTALKSYEDGDCETAADNYYAAEDLFEKAPELKELKKKLKYCLKQYKRKSPKFSKLAKFVIKQMAK